MITLLLIVAALIVGLFFIGTLIQVAVALIVGLLAGVIARAIMPGDQYMPWWQTALLGIGGSMVAGLVGLATGVDLGILGAIAGAVLVLFVVGRARASRFICIGGLVLALGCSGCATAIVNDYAGDPPMYGFRSGYTPARPYLYALLPLAIVFDIATSPIQVLWIGSQL